jgi:hypothetical protein
VTTLSRVAQLTGAAMNPEAKAVFDPGTDTIRYHEDLWPRFIFAAIVAFLADLLLRRVRIFDRKRTAKPALSRA